MPLIPATYPTHFIVLITGPLVSISCLREDTRSNQENEMVGHVVRMRNAYNHLVGKPEGTRPPRRPRRTWKDTIRMYLMEIGWEVMD